VQQPSGAGISAQPLLVAVGVSLAGLIVVSLLYVIGVWSQRRRRTPL
jgi:hypothetical protein